MRRPPALIAALVAALAAAATPARADEAGPRVCTARFMANDPLPLERRFVGLLTGDGCTAGDLLHFTFVGESLAAAVAARHCRFDRPVLLDRGEETHLVCVWHGTMRSARP